MKIRYLIIGIIVLFNLFCCGNKNQKLTENYHNQNTERNKSQDSVDYKEKEIFKEIPLSCEREDGISNNCKYEGLDIKIDYKTNPNKIVIQKDNKKYTYNLNFYFEGTGSNVLLFKKDTIEILLVELEYEYNLRLLAFKVSKTNISFLGSQEIEILDDENSFSKYKLYEIDDGINVERNTSNFKINFKNEIILSESGN